MNELKGNERLLDFALLVTDPQVSNIFKKNQPKTPEIEEE